LGPVPTVARNAFLKLTCGGLSQIVCAAGLLINRRTIPEFVVCFQSGA